MFEVSVGTIADIVSVESKIPEFKTGFKSDVLKQRLSNKRALILVVKFEGQVIAYKVGYEKTPEHFYSWIGAVAPEYRHKGIATQLRLHQEAWAREQGYKVISVKSMNRFPAMLSMLISSHYSIAGYEDNGSPNNSKIIFTKELAHDSNES